MIALNIVIDNSYFILLNNKKSYLLHGRKPFYTRFGEKADEDK